MTSHAEHERRFHGRAERLRSAERVKLLEVRRVVSLSIEGLRPQRILDVGTGTGIFAEAFSKKRGVHVAGIDANPDLLSIAHHHAPDVWFMHGRAEALPFLDGWFGLVFLGHVLHETDDPLRALKEAKRVSTNRVVVLEWPYISEEQGPPLKHRLRPERVLSLAMRAGFRYRKHLSLRHMDFYRFA
jgi:ubiquinone/menaquinone biosynthesis C-methylase UbiE